MSAAEDIDPEAIAKAESQKIGPFCFDIDNDIDEEVLDNQ